MKIWCVQCNETTNSNKVSGEQIYPHRQDLHKLSFYQCPACLNYVGTHKNSLAPLGVIPTPELRRIRQDIHALIDPIWQKRIATREQVYTWMSGYVGKTYHTANIRSVEEAKEIRAYAQKLYDTVYLKKQREIRDAESKAVKDFVL